MGLTPEAQRRIEAQKRLQEQIFIEPELETDGFPTTPYSPWYRTNNFIQQGLNRLFGWNPTDKKWYPLYADKEGRLLVSPEETDGAQVLIKDRESVRHVVLNNVKVINLSLASHTAVDVSECSKKSVLISTTGSITAYFQASDDNTNFYTLTDTSGADISLAADNEKISFAVNDYCHYFRVIIYNNSGAEVTVTVVVEGQA